MAYRNRNSRATAPEEQDYKKGSIARETHTQVKDSQTGKLIKDEHIVTGKADAEPDFIKLYLNTMMAFQGIKDIPTDILISMCRTLQGQFNNDGKTPLYFRADKLAKTQMSKELDMSIDSVNKYIKKMCNSGIIFKTDMRGIYVVNPWLIAKGKYSNIKNLQGHFDFSGGTWTVKYDVEEDEQESQETKKENKQLENQIAISEDGTLYDETTGEILKSTGTEG